MQVRDSLSKTLNTDIHVALSRLGGEDLNNLVQTDRSDSSTSGVYSSGGSLGSDSPDYHNGRRRRDAAMAGGTTGYVSTLTIRNTGAGI